MDHKNFKNNEICLEFLNAIIALLKLFLLNLDLIKIDFSVLKDELVTTKEELERANNKLSSSNSIELLLKLKDTIKNKTVIIEDNIDNNDYDNNTDNNDNNDNIQSKIVVESESSNIFNKQDDLINKEQLLIKQRRKNRKF